MPYTPLFRSQRHARLPWERTPMSPQRHKVKFVLSCEVLFFPVCSRISPHSLPLGAVAVHAAVGGLPAGLPGHPAPHLHGQACLRAALDGAAQLLTARFWSGEREKRKPLFRGECSERYRPLWSCGVARFSRRGMFIIMGIRPIQYTAASRLHLPDRP